MTNSFGIIVTIVIAFAAFECVQRLAKTAYYARHRGAEAGGVIAGEEDRPWGWEDQLSIGWGQTCFKSATGFATSTQAPIFQGKDPDAIEDVPAK